MFFRSKQKAHFFQGKLSFLTAAIANTQPTHFTVKANERPYTSISVHACLAVLTSFSDRYWKKKKEDKKMTCLQYLGLGKHIPIHSPTKHTRCAQMV